MMSRRTSAPPCGSSDLDYCNECSADQEPGVAQTQRELRRQRRRRGRSEPTCSECPPSQTGSRERSTRGHRRSSSSTDEGVTSTPDPNPAPHAEHRRSSSVSCSRHSRASSSRTRRRRARPNGRRRRSSGVVNPAPPPTCSSTEPESVSNQGNMNQNDPGNHSPQREAQLCQIRQWPHSLCFMFACLTCTLSMFGISRFAILTIDYGAIFLVQFLLLSLIFGIPMLTFFSSVGQYLGSGVIDMWRISPVFQGIGVSLMLAQGLYGIYNIAGISWLFIYFRDSFISSGDRYRWTMCFDGIKYGRNCDLNSTFVNSSSYNSFHQWKLEETIPDYFSGVVLMRSAPTYPHSFTALRFQTLFNMVVIWMPVFIALSKGLKSYGRVVFVLGGFPILSFLVFSTKIIGLMPMSHFQEWFVNTQWMEFLYNGQSWVCAARECFFTWGILGASIMQLSSHNTFKHKLIRDTTTVVIVTLAILLLAGFLGVAVSLLIIRTSGYEYTASSFETAEGYEFLRLKPHGPRLMREGRDYPPTRDQEEFFSDRVLHESDPFYNSGLLDSFDLSTTTESTFKQRSSNRFSPVVQNLRSPVRVSRLPSTPRYDREHVSFLAGIRIIQTGRSTDKYSGYQVMRLATELMPTYAAILGPKILSPFWVVLFYLTMIVMGLAQQMALVHTVASGLIAIRPDHFMQFESSLTFMSCLLGLVLCFPLATEFDVFIVYFFDYTIGCGWWLMLLYSALIFAIFIVRGKPYSAENVAMLLLDPERLINVGRTGMNKFCCHGASWVVPILAFTWNVILPVGMVILCIVSFKSCYFAEMFDWTTNTGYLYMPSWVREIGAMLQLLPLVLVPFVGIIQTCRYFLNGSDELFEKINMLYRPNFASQISRQSSSGAPGRGGSNGRLGRHNGVVLTNYNQRSPGSDGARIHNDPPPKYTPPPSYSTATGARIARFLRQSFRQSIRRFRGETWRHSSSTSDLIEENLHLHSLGPININGNLDKQEGPPPDYATVIIETSRHSLHPAESEISYGSFSPITIPTISLGVSSSDISELQPQENSHWRDHDYHVQSSEPVTATTLSSQQNPRFSSLSANRSLNQTVEDTSVHYAQIQPWNFRFSPNSQDQIGTERGYGISKVPSIESDYISVGQVTVLLDASTSNQISPTRTESGQGLAACWGSSESAHREQNFEASTENDPGFSDGIHGVDYMSVANVTIMKSNKKFDGDESISLRSRQQLSEEEANILPFNRSLTASPSSRGDISVVIHSDDNDSRVDDTVYSALSISTLGETLLLPDTNSNEAWKTTRQSHAVSPHRRCMNHPIASRPLTVSKMGIDLNESSTDDVLPESSEYNQGELNNLDSNFAQGFDGQLPDEQMLNRLYPRQLIFNIPPSEIVNEPQGVVTIQVDTSSSVI